MIRFQVEDQTFTSLPAAMNSIMNVETLLKGYGFSDAELAGYVSNAVHELHASMTRAATDAAMDESGVLAVEFREAVMVRELAA